MTNKGWWYPNGDFGDRFDFDRNNQIKDLNNNGIPDRLENRFDGDLNNNGILDRYENKFDQDLNRNGIPDRYENGSTINFRGRRCRIVCDRRDRWGRDDNCRIVCDDRRFPDNGGLDQNRIRRLILGRSLFEARRIYSNIRVVRQDGRDLIVTRDFRRDRANVEVNNGIIVRVLGFY